MIYSLLLLSIYIWPFGQLLTFSIPQIPFNIYLLDVVVLFTFVSLIFSHKRKEIFLGPVVKPLLVFLCVAIISLLINIRQGVSTGLSQSAFYLLRLIVYPSLFFAGRFVGFKKLKNALLVSIGIFSILCLLQYIFFPDMRYLKLLGFDDHLFRLIGSLYDPNFTGAILSAIALFFIGKNKILHSLPFICLLALTFSRASYLVFLIGIVIYLFTRKKIKLLFLLILLGLVVYMTPKPFGEGVNLLRTFSIYSRIDSWQQGIGLAMARPILGWGYNTLRAADGSRFQIDNSYIFILATTGILGLLTFLNLLFKLFKSTLKEEIRVPIISILIHGIFNNSLFYIWIMFFLFLLLGLGQEKTKEYIQS